MTPNHPEPPSLLALRALELVVRTGSMTEAARKLFVTRPAVSQMVKKLERQLGTPLVERRGRGIVATAEGARIAGIAGDVFERIEVAARHLQRAIAQRAVVCHCEASIAGTWLAPNWPVIQLQASAGRLVLRTFDELDAAPADANLVLSTRRSLGSGWVAESLAPAAWVRVRHPVHDPGERWYAGRADAAEASYLSAGSESVALALANAGVAGAGLPLYAAMDALRRGSVVVDQVHRGRGAGATVFHKSGERDEAVLATIAALRAQARSDLAAFDALAR